MGQVNYSTAKAGVLGLTRTIAKEWGSFGVRCNCVTYGFINTRLTQVIQSAEAICCCVVSKPWDEHCTVPFLPLSNFLGSSLWSRKPA